MSRTHYDYTCMMWNSLYSISRGNIPWINKKKKVGGREKPRWCCGRSSWASSLLTRTHSCWPPLVCAYRLLLTPVLSHPLPPLPLPLLLPLVLVLVLLPLGLHIWPTSRYVFVFAAGPAIACPHSFYSPLFIFPRPRSHLPLPPAFICVCSCLVPLLLTRVYSIRLCLYSPALNPICPSCLCLFVLAAVAAAGAMVACPHLFAAVAPIVLLLL